MNKAGFRIKLVQCLVVCRSGGDFESDKRMLLKKRVTFLSLCQSLHKLCSFFLFFDVNSTLRGLLRMNVKVDVLQIATV